eukprot:COSAG06_NODE_516_length_14818_cov_18.077926_7_plen_75_part_00
MIGSGQTYKLRYETETKGVSLRRGPIKSISSGTGEDWSHRLQPAKEGAVVRDVLVLSGPGLPAEDELAAITIVF